MNVRHMDIIFVITNVLAAFAVCLCASVSKILPFYIVAACVVLTAVLFIPQFGTFAVIKQFTQKTE